MSMSCFNESEASNELSFSWQMKASQQRKAAGLSSDRSEDDFLFTLVFF
jgi:hypothetical protein